MTPPEHAVPIESLLRHRAWVRGVARALVRGDQDADDIEQEAWLAAVKSPPPDDRSPRAWLGTVLRRAAAKLRLRNARREARERATASPERSSDADLVAEAEMHGQLVRRVLALPEPYRTTVLRRFFEDLTPSEIAARTGTPVGTVTARLSRALAMLRSELRDGDSRAWPATLVALAGSGAGKAGGATAAGVMVMTQAKTVAVAGLAIAVAVGFGIWALLADRGATHRSNPAGPASEVEPAPPAAAPPATPSPAPIRPRPFDPRAESPPSAPSRPAAQTATLTVNVIWGEDRTPAEGVTAMVVESGTKTGMWRSRWLVAGAGGAIRMTDLVPGRISVHADRGGSVDADVAPGDSKSVTLEIPEGPTVEGLVVALDGTPVGGAEVWLSTFGSMRSGTVVARTDARGAFLLRSVNQLHTLAARAAGHAQSAPHQIADWEPGKNLEVRLRLGGPAGSVTGVVRGPDDMPVAGAAVEMLSPPIADVTDEKGEFAIESVPPGDERIEIRVPGFAPWSGSALVKAGEVTRLEVGLQAEAVVAGTARHASGAPAAGVTISAGVRGHLLSSIATTAADGSFRLGSLAPGRIEVVAELPGAGRAAATLECPEGSEVRWDPVIDPGLRIVGVVRDDLNQPLANWVVMTQAATRPGARGGWRASATTDASGRFRIVNCPDPGPYRLETFDKNDFGAGVRAVLDGVSPREEDWTLVVSRKDGFTVKGRVLDHAGRPAAATIRMNPLAGERMAHAETDPGTGAFSASSVFPGRWRILVLSKPTGSLDLGERQIDAGATVELGDIRLPQPGRLVIDLSASPEAEEQVTYDIRPRRGPAFTGLLRFRHRELPRPLELPPGPYDLVVSGDRIEKKNVGFDVAPGKETRVEVATLLGVACELRFSFPDGESPSEVTYGITPVREGTSAEGSCWPDARARVVADQCVLRPGTYRLEARARSGSKGAREIVVAPGDTAVPFTLALESPWPADGLPVTFRFRLPAGVQRMNVDYSVAPADSEKLAVRATAMPGPSGLEGKARLKPGRYTLVITSRERPATHQFVVEPGEPAQAFEFAIDAP